MSNRGWGEVKAIVWVQRGMKEIWGCLIEGGVKEIAISGNLWPIFQ